MKGVTLLVFLDSNVPMYIIGADHPNKALASALVERLIASGDRLVTDAEVLQEILHRYTSINRREAIQPAFDLLHGMAEEVFPVDKSVVETAKSMVLAYPRLSARDAIHVATMQANGVTRILSFDQGFDLVPGIHRLDA